MQTHKQQRPHKGPKLFVQMLLLPFSQNTEESNGFVCLSICLYVCPSVPHLVKEIKILALVQFPYGPAPVLFQTTHLLVYDRLHCALEAAFSQKNRVGVCKKTHKPCLLLYLLLPSSSN